MKPNYDPPVVDALQPVVKETVKEPTPVVKEEPKDEIIDLKDVTETVNLYAKTVAKHFQYVNGALGFRTEKDRHTEMIGFIELTGRALSNTSYLEFEGCTLALIQELRKSKESLEDGTVLRLLHGLEKSGYPTASIANYRLFMTYLVRLAQSWPTRAKAAKLRDVETLSRNFNKTAQDNLNYFMRKLAAYKI